MFLTNVIDFLNSFHTYGMPSGWRIFDLLGYFGHFYVQAQPHGKIIQEGGLSDCQRKIYSHSSNISASYSDSTARRKTVEFTVDNMLIAYLKGSMRLKH